MEAFKEYAKVYDALNYEKDYAAEAKEIMDLVQQYSHERDILMVGCGTGKHDRELTQYGYRIHGIDLSEEMIKTAKKNSGELPITYETADIRHYDSHTQYPIVLSLFHVISYLNSNEDLLAAFETIGKQLSTGGIFIFDAWYGVGVIHDLPSVRVKRVNTSESEIMRIAEPKLHLEKNVVDVNYDIVITNKTTCVQKRIKETHSMRYLFTPEIETYLKMNGLCLLQCIDCKTKKSPTLDTWTAYFVAIKQ
ncbi:MAG: class I SAM-dependent methyltransferase [Lachnospiraceae bacterium]